jgi:hypothetical protein
VAAARRAAARTAPGVVRRVRVGDFFQLDWPALLAECPQPLLVLGNPPWVTNSALGVLGSGNLPPKQSLPGWSGLDGLTGKSNFDVSEWMIFRLLAAVSTRRATVAMLCKTAVARRVLTRAWESGLPLKSCEIRAIDAVRHFGARVDACLLVCRTGVGSAVLDCRTFESLETRTSCGTIGWRAGRLVADVAAYERTRHLLGGQSRWRSGIKHDCASVFEFRRQPDGRMINGLGEVVDLETDYLFPLLKSSDVARRVCETLSPSDGRGRNAATASLLERYVLVPQRRVGEETDSIALRAPKTWNYLQHHAERLDRRASRVYEKQPRFSIFGVGPYTFARWKVVVSGFYKTPRFLAVGTLEGRPLVCDDTCYFLPCKSEVEPREVASLLNGRLARDFLSAFVFPDAKRPLTAEILGSLDLQALSTAVATGLR